MSTHALGKGTVNLNVNILSEERSILGKLAFIEDMSTGAFVRRLLKKALAAEHPKALEEIEEARKRRKQIISGAVCALALLVSVAESFVDGDGSRFRKASRSVKVRTVLKNGLEMEVA